MYTKESLLRGCCRLQFSVCRIMTKRTFDKELEDTVVVACSNDKEVVLPTCWKQSTSRTFCHAVMAIDRWWERAPQWMN